MTDLIDKWLGAVLSSIAKNGFLDVETLLIIGMVGMGLLLWRRIGRAEDHIVACYRECAANMSALIHEKFDQAGVRIQGSTGVNIGGRDAQQSGIDPAKQFDSMVK